MSRSNYTDDCEHLELYRATVNRAIDGKRGQKMLRDMLAALDAMPVKELIQGELVNDDGQYCALGALGAKRGIDMTKLDEYDMGDMAATFGVARSLAAEVTYENDECGAAAETPAERWKRMRDWVVANILPTTEKA
jgi:hypothetical protein